MSETSRAKEIVRGALVTAAALGTIALLTRLPLLRWLVHGAEQARGAGLLGALGGAAALITATLLMAPVVPLIMLAGWIWSGWGLLIALPAAALSAAISFSISRNLARGAAMRLIERSPRAVQVFALSERGGPFTVALIRLTPIVPFTPGNAALGLTRLKLRDLVVGTLLGLLPGSLLYVTAGALLPSAESILRGDALQVLLARRWLLAGLLLALALLGGVTTLLVRRLRARPQR